MKNQKPKNNIKSILNKLDYKKHFREILFLFVGVFIVYILIVFFNYSKMNLNMFWKVQNLPLFLFLLIITVFLYSVYFINIVLSKYDIFKKNKLLKISFIGIYIILLWTILFSTVFISPMALTKMRIHDYFGINKDFLVQDKLPCYAYIKDESGIKITPSMTKNESHGLVQLRKDWERERIKEIIANLNLTYMDLSDIKYYLDGHFSKNDVRKLINEKSINSLHCSYSGGYGFIMDLGENIE